MYPLTRVECNISLPGGLEVSIMSVLFPTGAGRVGCLLVRSLRAWEGGGGSGAPSPGC